MAPIIVYTAQKALNTSVRMDVDTIVSIGYTKSAAAS